MADLASLQAIVYGRVQGVFFRDFVSRQANQLGLTGYVCNRRGEEALEVHTEGERRLIEELISHLKVGPPAAKVQKVVTNWTEYSGSYSGFSIRY